MPLFKLPFSTLILGAFFGYWIANDWTPTLALKTLGFAAGVAFYAYEIWKKPSSFIGKNRRHAAVIAASGIMAAFSFEIMQPAASQAFGVFILISIFSGFLVTGFVTLPQLPNETSRTK